MTPFSKICKATVKAVVPTKEKENGSDEEEIILLAKKGAKDGTLTNCEVLKGHTSAYAKEAMRLVSIMPNWSPGYVDGQPVRTAFTVPMYICWR
jgi:hypothetical protein